MIYHPYTTKRNLRLTTCAVYGNSSLVARSQIVLGRFRSFACGFCDRWATSGPLRPTKTIGATLVNKLLP